MRSWSDIELMHRLFRGRSESSDLKRNGGGGKRWRARVDLWRREEVQVVGANEVHESAKGEVGKQGSRRCKKSKARGGCVVVTGYI